MEHNPSSNARKRTGPEQSDPSDDDVDSGSNDAAIEGSSSDHETQELPRKPRRSSRWLMYICSWTFLGEVIFLTFVLLVGVAMFHQLFMQQPPPFGGRRPGFARPLRPKAPPPNYYAILNINPNATDREVRAAYHRQARIHHPDKVKRRATSTANSGGDSESNKQKLQEATAVRMRLIKAAYEALSVALDRCEYHYFHWPKSEGATPDWKGYDRFGQYHQCKNKARHSLFQKSRGDTHGDDDNAKDEDAEIPVEAGKHEEKETGNAVAKQQTTVGFLTVPSWKQYLVYAEKAGESYHTLCYGNPVARAWLFILADFFAWTTGVELPDPCLGGG
ncbi:DnaJ-domain-containing protein [Apiospora phragmitis]|uniref:DnaJ-domain-containing protein n=1 Tax=Apiospora phragmitis TaxID=2905665 RepID=A0ABR1SW85_9PEZI